MVTSMNAPQHNQYDILIGCYSIAGKRDRNEDFAAVRQPQGSLLAEKGVLALVADGVSSGIGGFEAAKTTGGVLMHDFYDTAATWEVSVSLDRILQAQNAWLYARGTGANVADATSGSFATTLTAINLRGHFFTVAHVGDTRAYLYRKQKLDRLTRDHVHSIKDLSNVLTRAMGVDEHLLVDYAQGMIEVGDIYIIISDGVYKALKDKDLAAFLSNTSTALNTNTANEHHHINQLSDDLAAQICQKALDNGSNDNISATVLIVRSLGEQDLRDTLQHARLASVPNLLKTGDQIDGLTVLNKVADNGFNLLYQVENAATGQKYALKTLSPKVASQMDEREALAHEIWLGHRIEGVFGAEHFPHIAHSPLPASTFYGLFDWHEGQSLEKLIDKKQLLPVKQTVKLGISLCKTLSAMSRLRVTHRDIKPANLHLGDDGMLRLIDWGSALSGFERGTLGARAAGTPSYMPAELWQNVTPDHASDVYAACVTLYELATGHLPYGIVEPYQTGVFARTPKAPSRLRPEIPKWLDQLLLKGVSTDQSARFTTAEELMIALENGDRMSFIPVSTTPLLMRDRMTVLKVLLALSVFINFMLICTMLVMPKIS